MPGEKQSLTQADLDHFIGTEAHHRACGFSRRFVCTDGVHYMRDSAAAYWLTDAIVSHQLSPKAKAEPFQVWTLKRAEGDAFTLTMTDGNTDTPIIQQDIPFSDFPLDHLKLYLSHDVILLPSEY